MYAYLPFKYLAKGMTLGELKFSDCSLSMRGNKEIVEHAIAVSPSNLAFVSKEYFKQEEKSGVNLESFLLGFLGKVNYGTLFKVACIANVKNIYLDKKTVFDWIVKSLKDDSFDTLISSLNLVENHDLLNNIELSNELAVFLAKNKVNEHIEFVLTAIYKLMSSEKKSECNNDWNMKLIFLNKNNLSHFIKSESIEKFMDIEKFRFFYEAISQRLDASTMKYIMYDFEKMDLPKEVWKYIFVNRADNVTSLEFFYHLNSSLGQDFDFMLEVLKEAHARGNTIVAEDWAQGIQWGSFSEKYPDFSSFVINNVVGIIQSNDQLWEKVASKSSENMYNPNLARDVYSILNNINFPITNDGVKSSLVKMLNKAEICKGLGFKKLQTKMVNDDEIHNRVKALIENASEFA